MDHLHLCTSMHLLTLLFYYYCCCTVCTANSYSAIFMAASVRNKLIHSTDLLLLEDVGIFAESDATEKFSQVLLWIGVAGRCLPSVQWLCVRHDSRARLMPHRTTPQASSSSSSSSSCHSAAADWCVVMATAAAARYRWVYITSMRRHWPTTVLLRHCSKHTNIHSILHITHSLLCTRYCIENLYSPQMVELRNNKNINNLKKLHGKSIAAMDKQVRSTSLYHCRQCSIYLNHAQIA